jgi:Carboxypeptidase regulatory-like domain
MKRRRSFLIVFAVLLFLSILIVALWRKPASKLLPTQQSRSAAIASPPSTQSTQQPAPSGGLKGNPAFIAEFKRPINFYGKVLDENWQPIAGANVELVPNDDPTGREKYSRYSTKTDAKGYFSMTGMHGIGINVDVSKEGYYRTEDSYAIFEHEHPSGRLRQIPSNPQDPALFFLRKKGEAAALIHAYERPRRVPKDGSPAEVSLTTGEKVSSGGDFKIECWVSDQDGKPYPWKCRLSVPRGGLIKRKSEFDFIAPESGYAESDDLEMPQVPPTGQQWSDLAAQDYFVKTSKGQYARMRFEINTGDPTFYVLESYLNPSGSRNLEYDKSKEIHPPRSWN